MGYLWLKARSPEAIKLTVAPVDLPQGEGFREIVTKLRDDAALGGRLSRAEYLSQIVERDREWFGEEPSTAGLEARLEQAYRAQEQVWQQS